MKNLTYLTILIFILLSCDGEPTTTPTNNPPATNSLPALPYRAVDLSFLPEIESHNIQFSDSSQTLSALDIFKNNGVNLIRLRLWHTPSGTHNSLEEVLAFAQIIKTKGMDWWLDIHYSDTWADPAHQTKPAAWDGLDAATLGDSVYNYTKSVLQTLKNHNCLPTIVQIGNETNSGFLWDSGKVGGSFDNNWTNFGNLLNKGSLAIREIDSSIQIMIHFAGLNGVNDWYFSSLSAENVDYDIIGISYYPWWHTKDLELLQTELNSLAADFSKDIIIAETAYPFTLDWADWTNNFVGDASHLIDGYPASASGQQAFLEKLRTIVANIPNDKGTGFCYWAPDWVAFKGDQAQDGSAGENLALFDFNFIGLPALKAFEE